MKISIIIPCYNEEKTIVKIVEKINALINLDKEIILVDDGSNDGTVDIIEKTVQTNVDHVVYHEKNLGKGSAIQSGLKYVTGDIIIIQDADLEYEPKDYERLIHPILNNEFLVVYGSRVLGIRHLSGNHFISQIRVFANYILTLLSNLINNQNLTDAHTCYKVFHISVIKKIKLQEKRFAFCPEITSKISKLGIPIKEIPINYKGRTLKEGKKINFLDAVRALYVLVKYRFF